MRNYEKVRELAKVIDSILWTDALDIIPQSARKSEVLTERHDFMMWTLRECHQLLEKRRRANYVPSGVSKCEDRT